jgi:hypothetical protein
LRSYYETKGLPAAVNEAVEDGDERGFIVAMYKAQSAAFVDLYVKRNALARIQLVEDLPSLAAIEFARMHRSVGTSKTPELAPVAAQAPVAPIVTESPIETCVREFKEMPSQLWKKKWLLDQRNRPITDRAFAEGKI